MRPLRRVHSKPKNKRGGIMDDLKSRIITVLKCAEADLYGCILDHMDLDPLGERGEPAVDTYQDIVAILKELEEDK